MKLRAGPMVVAVMLVLLAGPVAHAQHPGETYRVGLVFVASPISQMAGPEPVHPSVRAFLHEMRRLGYVEGRNLVFERRPAEGQIDRLDDLLADLLRLNMDVIVTAGNDLPRAAKKMTSVVPIIMASSRSPVEAGLVTSLARPGANVTGVSIDGGPEIEAKRLELLKEALPGISRVAFLGTKADWEEPLGQATQAAATVKSVVLTHAEGTLGQYDNAFGMLARERPGALFVANSASNYAHRHRIADFAIRSRLPAVYPFREMAEAGGELVINLKTAKILGLTIPQSLLLQADDLIEWASDELPNRVHVGRRASAPPLNAALGITSRI